ncbi:MAG: hypothetical protein QOJ86_5466 [Bradyrhizobium sp.]|nr:hypothetical protein [Bradyrhizobium sp.]
MSWPKRILITLAAAAALILLPIIGLVIYDEVRFALFNNSHPMLKAMSEQRNQDYAEDRRRMNDILLKRLPVGSTRSEALQILTVEGMECARPPGTAQRDLLVCYVTSPRVRWHIEVQFDENDRVLGGRVLTLKV